jgi:hypothetical protein
MPFAAPLRLTRAIRYAKPKASAFRDGFSLERQSQKIEQARYKKMLLTVLQQLNHTSHCAANLYQLLKRMPVTGRMRIETTLDGLFLVSHANPLLQPGDTLYLPALPTYIEVIGWAGNKKLNFKSDYLLTDYLKKLVYSQFAEKNFVYVITPAGKVDKVKVAYWNRKNYLVAPGSLIYVPIAHTYVKKIAHKFNLKMAQFLSTQRIS